jgi:hypothetical protein
VPATLLRAHPNATAIADRPALGMPYPRRASGQAVAMINPK